VLASIGCWDKDVPDRYLMAVPRLYELGRKDTLFNFQVFWLYIGNGIVQAVAAYLLTLYAYDAFFFEMWTAGTFLFTLIVFVSNFKIALEKGSWNWVDVVVWVVSSLTWPAVALLFQAPIPFNLNQTSAWLFTDIFTIVMSSAQTWALGFMMTVLLLFRDWTWKQTRPLVAPELRHHMAYHAKLAGLAGRPFNDPTPLDPAVDFEDNERALVGLAPAPEASVYAHSPQGAFSVDSPLRPDKAALDPARAEV